MSNMVFLSRTVDVRLSLSDWLLLCGWCSAHLTEETPCQITAAVREIGKRVAEG